MTKHHAPQVVILTLFAILLAILWLPAAGTTDVKIFLRWEAAAAISVRGSYATFSTFGYPPLGFVFLRGAALIAKALNADLFTGFKLSLLLGLVLTGGLFWLWTRNFYLSLGLFLALLPNSMAYGYTDIYFAPFLVGALWALHKNKLALFTVLYCGACLVKLQPLVLAPYLVIYLLGVQHIADWRQIAARRLTLRVILPAALMALGTLAIFGKPVVDALSVGLTNPFLSGQALNLNWIVTFGIRALNPQWFGGLSDGLIIPIDTQDWHALLWSKILFWLLFAPSCLAFARSKKSYDDLILFGLCGYLTYCMLNTGVHENHLFMAVLLAGVLAWRRRENLSTFAIWALVANTNLFVFYGADGSGLPFSRVVGVDITLLLALVFVAQFVGYYYESVVVGLSQGYGAK
jgi:Gpi18-like mannosyltransferase